MQSINPVTNEVVQTVPDMTETELHAVLLQVRSAWAKWRRTAFADRSALMRRAADILKDRKEQYARLMAIEMGKPVRQGRAEIDKCAWVCEYYADHAESFLQPEVIVTDAEKSYVACVPLGVVLAVMPWNFPFWQVFRFAAPALMAGNAGVLKHASNVPGCALAIEDVFRSAGFPGQLFRTVCTGGSGVPYLIRHPVVSAVTLTGSTQAGRAVAREAGTTLKKTVLELGGSDPYVILADADLPRAVEACVAGRLINTGQSCIAAKRFIVVRDIWEDFVEQCVAAMGKQKMGDPLDETTDIGPMARVGLRDDLHAQVLRSIALGARCLLGGEILDKPGAWYPPTVLTDVAPGMPAYEEEMFGPVAALIRAKDERDAIRIANDSAFGLGAAVFTRDSRKGEALAARDIDAGSCFVNTFVRSDPRLPFGGIKDSGYGRELAHHGIREFVNIKTVYLA